MSTPSTTLWALQHRHLPLKEFAWELGLTAAELNTELFALVDLLPYGPQFRTKIRQRFWRDPKLIPEIRALLVELEPADLFEVAGTRPEPLRHRAFQRYSGAGFDAMLTGTADGTPYEITRPVHRLSRVCVVLDHPSLVHPTARLEDCELSLRSEARGNVTLRGIGRNMSKQVGVLLDPASVGPDYLEMVDACEPI